MKQKRFVNLVIENDSRYTDQFFTYQTEEDLSVGDIVYVGFGRGKKLKRAFVMETDATPDPSVTSFRDAGEKDPDLSLSGEMIRTACWMRSRYAIKYIDGIRCFLPPGKPARPGREKMPYRDMEGTPDPAKQMTREQEEACRRIDGAIRDGRQENFLIHGVTSSGKTEVYMDAIDTALSLGKTAIMLVPEIALTTQILSRFIGRFGRDQIAVLHSRLTIRERHDEWQRLRSGKAKICIGARMGVFAPLENIGCIILDEEHESTYKADQSPKYETVDVALKRLMAWNGVLILGSATPSVVSYYRAEQGIYHLIEMKERYNKTPLPDIQIVDRREELKAGNDSVFGSVLTQKIRETLSRKQQVILFLNRRGYSTSVRCVDCGEPLRCPECGITLVYHKRENAAVCHYCGKKFPVPDKCPECGSSRIRYLGAGTEKIEEMTRDLFPGAEVARLDLDTAGAKGEIERIIRRFEKRQTDILIGTQLVAKGLDFQNVGLVGVVSADVSLNIPDYRSTERTFQLVTQVAGRAGRGREKGLVIVQTYTPDNFALRAAAAHSYREFYRTEIRFREIMEYPPFSDLIVCEFTSKDETIAAEAAEKCKAYLIRAGLPNADRILAPKITENFKGQDSFRYHIMAKCPKGRRNEYIYYLQYFGELQRKHRTDVSMVIDVNPYSSF
ncbi:MAG: replication restart helicase PriA [Anaerovoracaceae bacterium]|jgi:primosomal protein N' (replication factor Y)